MPSAADGFLDRIRAAPDDDGPRLIYADWLDAVGDPRGEFVRVQLALARLGPHDRRRPALATAEREFLDRYSDQWAAPVAGLATGAVFRRGFVEAVTIPARRFVEHADKLFAAAPVRHVHLLDVGSSLRAVFASPHLARLTGLKLFAERLGEPLAHEVAGCPHLECLRSLDLGRNRIGDDGAALIAGSPALAALTDLDLSENDITEAGAERLAAAARDRGLRTLNLAGNAVGPVGATAVAALPGLHRLGLASCRVGGPRLAELHRPEALLAPAAVDLTDNRLTAADLPRLLADEPVGVRELGLGQNDVNDRGAGVLAQTAGLAGLRELRLSNANIGDVGLGLLAGSPYLGRLAALDLANNPIGDDGIRSVLESPTLRHLTRLQYAGFGLSFRVRLALETRFHKAR